MMPKVAIQTLLLIAAWLFLQNFNVLPDAKPHSLTAVGIDHPTGAAVAGLPEGGHFFRGEGNYKIKKVVLDAGHGGKDPGCIGANAHEKDNTLSVILKLGRLIEDNYPDIDVIYTRKEDVFVELYERAAIANRNAADLFISVHCNALSSSTAKGAETYVLGLHRALHNLEVAKRENASIYLEENYQKNYEGYDPNSAEAHIFGSVLQSAYLEQSILLAGFVQQQAKAIGGREDRGVKQAGFLVLRETAMPAVLIETGYLTNHDEEEYLASEEGQQLMAEAIFEGFNNYKNRMEENTVNVAAKQKPIAAAKGTPAPKQPTGPKAVPVANRDKNSDAIQSGQTAFNKPQGTSTGAVLPKSGKTTGTALATNPAISAAKPTANAKTTEAGDAKTPPGQGGCRILLMSHTIPMDRRSGQFALLNEVKEEKRNGKYCYFTGTFASRTEAEKMLPEIRNLGFATAKIDETSK